MPITPADIVLLESERMRDTPDGGGRMTSNVIPSGQAGNVFPKVSRVDSVYGRVNLRKIYLAVRTATLDMYAGAHVIITAPPSNDRISCTLFSTGSSFDQRSAARDRIESYVVAGPISRMRVYGQQIIGQRAVLVYQRTEDPLPDVGDVFVLSIESGAGSGSQQYVRITDVDHEVRTFTDNVGDFRRRVVTLTIGSTLQQTFPGGEVSRYATDPSPTKIRQTNVADASRYYGLQPLAEPVTAGAVSLRVGSVYAPLVPSTQRETGVSLAEINGAATDVRAGNVRSVSRGGFGAGSTAIVTITLGHRIERGTAIAMRSEASGGPVQHTDNGNGLLTPGNYPIDYETGTAQVNYTPGSSYSLTLSAAPSAQVSSPAHTAATPVTLGTRGTVYVEMLNPLPAPGTVVVDFRALGKWYRLRDNGAGVLVANDPSEGTGTVDYVTGALVVTLGALPDVGSAGLRSWGSHVHYARRDAGDVVADTAFELRYSLGHAPVKRGTVTVRWIVGSATRTATDNGNGAFSGTGMTGTIAYHTGEIRLRFTTPPNRASMLETDYTWRDGDEEDLFGRDEDLSTAHPVVGGQFTVPGTGPYKNTGSMLLQVQTVVTGVEAYIDAGGALRVRAGAWAGNFEGARRWRWADQQVGTFNSTTGVVTITGGVAVTYESFETNVGGTGWFGWVQRTASLSILSASAIVVEVDTDAGEGDTWNPQTVTAAQTPVTTLRFDLTPSLADAIVPASLIFTATGLQYRDRNGTLYTDVSPETGAGLAAGTIDYTTGVALLTWWADNAAVNRSVQACLTTYGTFTATAAFFRTAGSPVRPASTYVQVLATDGTLLTGTADQNGVIAAAWMRGQVVQEMGVVSVEFGQYEGENWIPREVLPATLRYNTVVLTNLPLDANILGLDPVRLPADGRVPIYRPADVAVLHNTQTVTLPNPVTAGATYDVERTGLAALRLDDADGQPLAADRYLVDLEAGTVTIAADWTGAGVAQPLVAVHRIEDMVLLSDVQINGEVSFDPAISRDYPTEGSYLSSALLGGDMQAMVSNLFDQQTWTGTWSNSLQGSQATAQYNDIDWPVEVLNESAVTERWRINFTSATAFQVIGENLGQIATGNTSTNLAPVNPVTGQPYFVLRSAGWGGGWATGNQLRFNTTGANRPVWCARTILAGASLEGDQFDLEGRGDVD